MTPFNNYKENKQSSIPITSTSSVFQVATTSTPSFIRCSTPMPEDPISMDVDDAWNPDATFRRIERPVHWLEHEGLKNARMKLFVQHRFDNILEFKEVIGDEVRVRDGRWTKFVPLEDVRAIQPTEVGDLVTPLTGPMIGVALKVREIQGDHCVVRQPGKVLKKKETDPSYPIACLIQIFPYLK
jgi:hypothetical protein